MKTQSVNPFTGHVIREYTLWNNKQIETALTEASEAYASWRKVPLMKRLESSRRWRGCSRRINKNGVC